MFKYRTILLAISASLLLGCNLRLVDGGPYTEKFLYQADVIITSSYALLDTFTKWEYDNRATLAPYPEIKKAADEIRRSGETWIDSAIALRDAYASAPSSDKRAALQRALTILNEAGLQTIKYINKYGRN